MRVRRILSWFAIFLQLAAAGAAPARAEEAAGRALVLAIGGEPETGYDPLMGWGSYGHPLFQSTLMVRDADLQSQPDLAQSATLSSDRLEWTVRIRTDARFSDGSPLTAQDVAFTFTKAKDAAGALDLSALDSAQALDDRTILFRLKRPAITFTEFFHTLGIVPAASYGPGYARMPIGSGPYRLVSWQEGEQLIVERNPLYYGAAPQFDRITFLFTGEDGALAAARAGAADIVAVPGLLAERVPDGYVRTAVQTVDNRGISLPTIPAGRQDGEGRPIGHDVTADLALRRAIDLAVNRDALVAVALGGQGTPAFGPADGLPWGADARARKADPQAAAALLDQAGWRMGDDGVRSRAGVRASLPLNYPAGDRTRQVLAEAVSAMLQPLGIQLTPKGGSWSAIRQVMHAEPVVFGFGSHSPFEVYSLYHSSLAGNGYMNPTYYANPSVDAHLDAAQSAASLDESYPAWRAAAFDGTTGYDARGDVAYAWLVNLKHVYFVRSCLDLGRTQIEPHGHGWPITAGLSQWRWTCP